MKSVTSKDISEVRLSEEKFSKAFNSSLLMSAISDVKAGVYIDVNDTFCHELGYQKKDLIGKSSGELGILSPAFRKKMLVEHDLEKGIRNIEMKIRKKDGEELDILFSAELIYVQDKQYMYSTGLNITETKKTQAKLAASEKKFRAIFDVIGVGIALTDEEGKIIDCNTAYQKVQLLTKEQLIGRKFTGKSLNVVRPDLSPMPMDEFAGIRAIREDRGIHAMEEGVYQPDGALSWLSVNAEPLHLPGIGAIISYMDITDRVKAEKALREKEELYRTVTENITDVIWVLNINQNKFTYISPSVYQLRGFTPEEAMQETMLESLAPESVEEVISLLYPKLEKFLANPEEKGHHYNELQQRCKDGHYVWIETITQFQLAKNGEVEILGVSRNIEKRKQTELALRDSEARLKLSIETANEGTWDWNVVTDEVLFNAKWAEMLGYELDELEKHLDTWKSLVHPNDFPAVGEALEKHLKGAADIYKAEYRLRKKSGDWIWVEDVGKVVEWDDKGNPTRMIGLHYDLSPQKEIQQKLLELNATKDKFFSIIAHDLKNPFSSILGFSNLIEEDCKVSMYENVLEYNSYVLQSAKSGYELLVNLLDWSRLQNGKMKFNPENFNLFASVRMLAISFQASLNEKELDFQILFPPELRITADRLMVETILRNLISNAIKFTPNKGKISVNADQSGGKTDISVSDTGVGISPDRVDKLFKIEENTSTAGTRHETGTGLGLVLCKDFVKQHHGTICIVSELNKGTTFTVSLP
ncbi:MAG: PAS domain S-box protein [Bacteroidales bacterium]|nr:PAS domain S-box protein [Bacteroidales bacterium]